MTRHEVIETVSKKLGLNEEQKIKVVEKGNFKSGHQSFFKFYDEVYNDLKGGPLEGLNTKQSGEAVVKQLTCLL